MNNAPIQTAAGDAPDRLKGLSPAKRALIEMRMKKAQEAAAKARRITPRANREMAPLSFNQELLWLIEQLNPDTSYYTVPRCLRLAGTLNVPAFQRTLDALVERHEVLRTAIRMIDGQPMQVVQPPRATSLQFFDLRPLPAAEREAENHRLIVEAARRPFDLTKDLIQRATLVQLEDELHVLLYESHHIASDGGTRWVLFKELTAFYDAFCKGIPPALPPLPIQYADFAIWQREFLLDPPAYEKQLSFWKQQLIGAPLLLEFPNAKPRPALQSFTGHATFARMPLEVLTGVKALCQQEGATLFITLLAGFFTFLFRYTKQEDLVIGTPISGRNWPEVEELIGYFSNTLVLRMKVSGRETFREFLRRVRTMVLAAYDNQDMPLVRVVEMLNPPRSASYAPVFQSLFAVGQAGTVVPELHELRVEPEKFHEGTTKFDILFGMTEYPDYLAIGSEYSTALFEEPAVQRMFLNFQTLLEGIVRNPDQRLADLPLLSDAERRQVLEEWNQTGAPWPREKCLHELIEAQVARTPDAIAAEFDGRSLTYRELNARANQLANYLRRRGVGADVRVGICVDRSLELVVGLLAILKAGGACVPLDPDYPQHRLEQMLKASGVPVLLTVGKPTAELPQCSAERLLLDADWPTVARESNENPGPQCASENLAYVIFTSGSTGQPKGVLLSHAGLVNHLLLAIQQYGLVAADRVLQFSALSFDIAVEEIFPSLIAGARIVFRTESMPLDPPAFAQWIERRGVTVLDLPTAYWHELVRGLTAANSPLPAGLRLVIVGGEKAQAAAFVAWQNLAGDRVRWVNTYGPTETSVVATHFEPSSIAEFRAGTAELPIGRPNPNVQIYLLDANFQPVPVEVPGELYIGGAGLARGYLDHPELTAEKFLPNPFGSQPGARLYKTGDLARYRFDGQIEFLGRGDDQVKIRGYRIELGEIENWLNQQPGVGEAVVLAREDSPGAKTLVAYLVLSAPDDGLVDRLRDQLKDKLPDYMVPSAFVVLDEFPLTPNGKIDRRALPAPNADGVAARGPTYVAPRSPIEEIIAGVWAEVLKVEKVGAFDNFFDLGGHSLLATQVISRLRDSCGVELTLRHCLEAATVEALAELIAGMLMGQAENAVADPSGALA